MARDVACGCGGAAASHGFGGLGSLDGTGSCSRLGGLSLISFCKESSSYFGI